MPDPLPYDADQIGQLPASGDPRTTINYYLRVIKALIESGGGAVPTGTGYRYVEDGVELPTSRTIVPSDISGLNEAIQDMLASFLVSGSGMGLTYDDVANTLTFVVTNPLTDEAVQDIVGAMTVAGSNVTATYNDASGTLTIDATGDGTGLTQEQVEDIVAALLVQGSNVTLSYNDASGQLTITAAGAAGALLAANNLSDVANVATAKSNLGLNNVTNDAQLKAADLDTDGAMTANSSTKIPSQSAVVTYVTAAVAAIRNGVSSAFDTLAEIATELALKAPLASPALTGTPTAPTATAGNNTTQIATTQFVTTAVAAGGGSASLDESLLMFIEFYR